MRNVNISTQTETAKYKVFECDKTYYYIRKTKTIEKKFIKYSLDNQLIKNKRKLDGNRLLYLNRNVLCIILIILHKFCKYVLPHYITKVFKMILYFGILPKFSVYICKARRLAVVVVIQKHSTLKTFSHFRNNKRIGQAICQLSFVLCKIHYSIRFVCIISIQPKF